jgi:hypothetical protein
MVYACVNAAVACQHLRGRTEFEDGGCGGGELPVIATGAHETAAGWTWIVF